MGFSAAVATPFGMRPVRYKNGTPWNGAGNWYFCPTSVTERIGLYEPVATTGAAHAVTGAKQVQRYTAGSAIIGVTLGFLPEGAYSPTGSQGSLAAPIVFDQYAYRVGATAMWVLVADDPSIIFQCQEDGDTTPIAAASVGLNCELITAANCSTVTGLSVAAIDSSEVAGTATLNVKILGLSPALDGSNAIGESYNMFDVTINSHELAQGTGSTGI